MDKNKKATIDTINKRNNKFFQYAVTVALNHQEIKKDAQKITKIKSFINKYNREGINYPSEENGRKKFEKNNLAIGLFILMFCMLIYIYIYIYLLIYICICPIYVSKNNSNRQKAEGWHCLVLENYQHY